MRQLWRQMGLEKILDAHPVFSESAGQEADFKGKTKGR